MQSLELKKQVDGYERKTIRSKELHFIAKNCLPGGNTRSVTYYEPYPLFIVKGKGFEIYDADGNSYIDFINNYTSLIHGHAHPKILDAVKEQLKKGSWACPASLESQYKLAEIICERFPSVDKVRFCNSGSEATMFAVRAAIAYTGKEKILKMEGGYHGTCPPFEISVHPEIEKAGPYDRPLSVPDIGIPKNVVKDVLITQFNNKEVTEKIVKENRDSLAAIIVEPMMGAAGAVPQKEGYLKFLREITQTNDILLIFDEVQTSRLSKGGGQEFFGVTPDLSAFAKIIGGGFPVGAFGGSDDVMELFSPEKKEFISHSGTFNGNGITMAAGIATLKMLTTPVINRINSLGALLKRRIERIFEDHGIIGQVTGTGSIYNIHFTSEEVVDFRTAETSCKEARKMLHIGMLNKGIFMAPRGMFNISTPMTKKELQKFVDSFPIDELKSL